MCPHPPLRCTQIQGKLSLCNSALYMTCIGVSARPVAADIQSSIYPSGNGANAEEKRVALQMADSFIEQMKYPRMKTQVQLVTARPVVCTR